MAALEIYQALWAMQPHGPDGAMVPLERTFEKVVEAGHDGMAIDLGAADMDATLPTRPRFARHGLGCLIMASPQTVEGLRPVLHMANDFGAIAITGRDGNEISNRREKAPRIRDRVRAIWERLEQDET